jgi:uncharacterized protein (TIGR03067 family)
MRTFLQATLLAGFVICAGACSSKETQTSQKENQKKNAGDTKTKGDKGEPLDWLESAGTVSTRKPVTDANGLVMPLIEEPRGGDKPMRRPKVAGPIESDQDNALTQSTLRLLAGAWEIAVDAEDVLAQPDNREIHFSADEVRFVDDEKRERKAAVRLNPLASPPQVDFVAEVDGEELVFKGIYRLTGDSLTLCLAAPDADRPLDFDDGGNAHQVIFNRAD